MAIFLKVLSIFGIVLLSILALILLILLLVLFVPVRYKVNGEFKDNKAKLAAKATWLLHIVSVVYRLEEDNPLTIRIFGFKLKQKKEEKLPDFDSEEDGLDREDSYEMPPVIVDDVMPEAVTETGTESVTETVPEPVAEPITEPVIEPEIPEIKDSEPEEFKADEPEPETPKKVKKEKKQRDDDSENKDFENHGFYDKIKKYIEIIESKRFKKAFEYSKKKVFKLLKHIKPRCIDIKGEVGFDDPSLTGTVIAITSMLIPVFGNSVRITGNFEEPVISIEGKIKGHITIFRVLWTTAVLYFNKDLRKIIKMFREV